MAARGARLVVSDIKAAAARLVAEEINHQDGMGVAAAADVTREEQVAKPVSACMARFDTVDILANKAGIIHTPPLTAISAADWDRVMAVDLKGVFLCCRAVFPIMMRWMSGKIINIASVAGKRGGGLLGNACYAAAKDGVIAFAKSVAREGALFGINVNAVTPGLTDTDMTKGMNPGQKAASLQMIPLGRPGQPEDVAKAVCFPASGESDYLTGEIMDVDGVLMMD